MKEFEKIIGYEKQKEQLYQIIDMFKNYELYKSKGSELPRGIILHGAPGMGKTMLAAAFIEACGVKTYKLVKNKNGDDTISEINKVFDSVLADDEAIVFIDDIDKFAESGSLSSYALSFSAIQSGINLIKDKKALVIATANDLDDLPDSLYRSGRFDRIIEICSPSSSDAEKIIQYYMSNKSLGDDATVEDISKMFTYKSCADLQNLINQASIYATYARKEKIGIEDIIKAQFKDSKINYVDKFDSNDPDIYKVAFHEAGHVVLSEVISDKSVGFVNITNSELYGVGGNTFNCKQLKRRPELVMVSLAGKAAVELFVDCRCNSGCQSDLSKAITLITDGINKNATHGFANLTIGHRSYDDPSANKLYAVETLAAAELERYFRMTKTILLENKDFLFKLADLLYKKGYLLYSDIRRIKSEVVIKPFEIY